MKSSSADPPAWHSQQKGAWACTTCGVMEREGETCGCGRLFSVDWRYSADARWMTYREADLLWERHVYLVGRRSVAVVPPPDLMSSSDSLRCSVDERFRDLDICPPMPFRPAPGYPGPGLLALAAMPRVPRPAETAAELAAARAFWAEFRARDAEAVRRAAE